MKKNKYIEIAEWVFAISLIVAGVSFFGFILWYEKPISETNYQNDFKVVDKYTHHNKNWHYYTIIEDKANDIRIVLNMKQSSWDRTHIGDILNVSYDRYEYRHDNVGYKINSYSLVDCNHVIE